MAGNFSEFLLNQHWMKILYALLISFRPRSLRELADMTNLSVSTVQDIVRRLKKNKIVSSKARGNKVFYSLEINPKEQELIKQIIDQATQSRIRKQASKYSLRREKVIGWIDETIETLHQGRRN